MNKEVVKAIEKSNNNKTDSVFKKIKKWWKTNGYKVMRVILFPIWLFMILQEKFQEKIRNNNKWDEARATEILEYYIPRYCNYNPVEQSFHFFDNGMGWNFAYAKKFLKRKDYNFWKTNAGWFGGEIRTLLITKFNLDGFTKEIGNCSDGWTEINFYLQNDK